MYKVDREKFLDLLYENNYDDDAVERIMTLFDECVAVNSYTEA